MINSVEWEVRMRTKEASDDIVEPFRKVVGIAMSRVRDGEIDSLDRQHVALLFEEGRRIYLISEMVKEQKGLFRETVTSAGSLDCGLFIDGVQLDENGNPVSELTSIQIPRDIILTTKETLFIQRGSKPEDVNRLANELKSARQVDQSLYDKAHRAVQRTVPQLN